MKLDILAIGVHPDDIELACCGTLLSHIAMGKKVGLCDLTQGELGTRGSAKLRLEEAENARVMMGALVRENLGLADGFFDNSEASQKRIISIIRKYQPEIVLANAIVDRHPDHGRAAQLISDACYYSGLVKIKDDLNLAPWRPKAVYHYVQDYNLSPDLVVDISPYMDQKIALIQCFSSQFFTEETQESSMADTPISGKDFLAFTRAKNRVFGRHAGYEYAEGFNVARPIATKNLFGLD